jgi:diaminopropionate ammonia-lyase
MHEIILNPNYTKNIHLPYHLDKSAINFHKSIQSYQRTKIISLKNLAKSFDIQNIYVKDESKRFSLDTFKALGPIYALYQFYNTLNLDKFSVELSYLNFFKASYLNQFGNYVFTTATDGNHGKALAWACKLIGQKSVIYVPSYTVQSRMDAIEEHTDSLIKINGTYQETVDFCYHEADKYKRQVITDSSSETSYQSGKIIMEAYLTMFYEIEEEKEHAALAKIDHIFLQCGVGSLTASGLYFYLNQNKEAPKIINVEPFEADCVYQSILSGKLSKAKGSMKTMMAGLNCDLPSFLAWNLFKEHLEYTMLIDEKSVEKALQIYNSPIGDDDKIISAESGAASLAAVIEVLSDKNSRKKLEITQDSSIMIINTEANTDPENIKRILNEK